MMKEKNIDAILFDMGGTLRSCAPDDIPQSETMLQIMDLVDAQGPPEEFGRKLSRRAGNYKRWSEQTLCELVEEELWARWMLPDRPADEIEALAVQLNQLWRSARGVRTIRPDARDVIRELVRRGYRLGLVSNTTSRLDAPRILEEIGVTDCFETVVLSATFGQRKPHPAIFLKATTRMQVHPDRTAYVGDQLSRDVAGPRRAGLALGIIIQEPGDELPKPLDAALTPDHIIHSLTDLLAIF